MSPALDVPAVPRPTTDGVAAPPELRWQFWLLVAVLNLALLAAALGALVLVFWRRPALGLGLLALGAGAGAYAWRRYRRVRAGLDVE